MKTNQNGIVPEAEWYISTDQESPEDDSIVDVLFICDNNREICNLPLEDDNEEANKEIEWNAKLISQAPRMFNLLKEFYTSREFMFEHSDIKMLDSIFETLAGKE